MREVCLPAKRVQQEQLGDLKLYRVPERTTLASRQSKQVRLMDQSGIPVTTIYGVDLGEGAGFHEPGTSLASDEKHASRITWDCHCPRARWRYSVRTTASGCCNTNRALRDTAVDEEVEIDMGESSDVQVSVTHEKTSIDSAHAERVALGAGSVPALGQGRRRSARRGQQCPRRGDRFRVAAEVAGRRAHRARRSSPGDQERQTYLPASRFPRTKRSRCAFKPRAPAMEFCVLHSGWRPLN